MSSPQPAFIKVELKYCERCGGLWLRREGDLSVYCGACAPQMSGETVPGEALLPVGRPRLPRLQGVAAALYVAALALLPWVDLAGGCA